MNLFKRALLYITRKKGKSIIMLCILFGIATGVLTGISIKKAAGVARNQMNKDLVNSFDITNNFQTSMTGRVPDSVVKKVSEVAYEVIEAEDGEEAVKLFDENNVDLVILDIMLPKLNGFGVLNKIRETSSTPVIMLTAMSDNYTQIMSFNEQADDYITKPFSVVILQKRIEAILRRSKSLEDINKVWK